MFIIRPRAYIDWTVPTDAEGNEVGLCTGKAEYRFYVEWLAEYLFCTEIEVPESQKEVLDRYLEKGVDHAVLDLSDSLGYTTWETEVIQEMSATGVPFSERHQTELDFWNELSPDEQEDWSEEDFFTSAQDYARLGEEYKASKKIPSHIQHADIPYRPILAALFKNVTDPGKRYDLLDFFYRNFADCASK